MSPEILKQLAPTGTLRAGINLGNFLLVTGKSPSGDPEGVAPDMARAIAERLGVKLKLVPFKTPGELADAAGSDVWDIGLIGAEPARAERIAFSAAYAEIEATYLVPAGSALRTIAEVDRPGIRIAVSARSAYDLWLVRNIRQAQLVHADGIDAAFNLFVNDKLEALASLRPRLLTDVSEIAWRADSGRAVYRRAAGGRHGQDERGGSGIPARFRGGGKGVRLRRQPDRAPSCGGIVGCARGMTITEGEETCQS